MSQIPRDRWMGTMTYLVPETCGSVPEGPQAEGYRPTRRCFRVASLGPASLLIASRPRQRRSGPETFRSRTLPRVSHAEEFVVVVVAVAAAGVAAVVGVAAGDADTSSRCAAAAVVVAADVACVDSVAEVNVAVAGAVVAVGAVAGVASVDGVVAAAVDSEMEAVVDEGAAAVAAAAVESTTHAACRVPPWHHGCRHPADVATAAVAVAAAGALMTAPADP